MGLAGRYVSRSVTLKLAYTLAILHPLTINCHPVSCIYDGIRQILTLIIPILGNICKRVANFRHKIVSRSRLLVCDFERVLMFTD